MVKLGIDVAITQIGVAEATGHNDGVPAERYNRGDHVAWCASLALFCNEHSDEQRIAPTVKDYYELRLVQAFEDRMKARGWWFAADVLPQRGDYVFFGDRGQSDAALTGRHMGLVEGLTHSVGGAQPGRARSVLLTVEGNWGNCVQRVRHSLDDPKVVARITGYARVPLK
jgi:hypothetical protein